AHDQKAAALGLAALRTRLAGLAAVLAALPAGAAEGLVAGNRAHVQAQGADAPDAAAVGPTAGGRGELGESASEGEGPAATAAAAEGAVCPARVFDQCEDAGVVNPAASGESPRCGRQKADRVGPGPASRGVVLDNNPFECQGALVGDTTAKGVAGA